MGGEERADSRERAGCTGTAGAKRRTAPSKQSRWKTSRRRGCGPPVRGYTGAPPTAPPGASKMRRPLAAGSAKPSLPRTWSTRSRPVAVRRIATKLGRGARPKNCVVCARDRSRRPRPHLAVSVHESPGPRLAGGARHDKSLRTFCFRRGSSRHTAHSSKACRTVVVMTPCSARRSRTSERSASRRARERSASKRIS